MCYQFRELFFNKRLSLVSDNITWWVCHFNGNHSNFLIRLLFCFVNDHAILAHKSINSIDKRQTDRNSVFIEITGKFLLNEDNFIFLQRIAWNILYKNNASLIFIGMPENSIRSFSSEKSVYRRWNMKWTKSNISSKNAIFQSEFFL